MSKYSPQIALALRLIAAKGQRMTLTRLSFVEYNPLAPNANLLTIEDQCPVNGVVLPASQGTIEAFDNRILDDPMQRRSFRFCILAAAGLTFEPRAQDVLLTTEGPWRILGATPLNPAGDGAIIFNVGATLDTQIIISGEDQSLLVGDGSTLATRD